MTMKRLQNALQKEYHLIEYVKLFKGLFLTEVNALYTYDTYQFGALQICRQMLLYHRNRVYQQSVRKV